MPFAPGSQALSAFEWTRGLCSTPPQGGGAATCCDSTPSREFRQRYVLVCVPRIAAVQIIVGRRDRVVSGRTQEEATTSPRPGLSEALLDRGDPAPAVPALPPPEDPGPRGAPSVDHPEMMTRARGAGQARSVRLRRPGSPRGPAHGRAPVAPRILRAGGASPCSSLSFTMTRH